MENSFLTVREASKYLGVKPSSLYSLVEEKEIPHYRVGRLIKFKKADLDAFMEERRVDRVDIEKVAQELLNPARNPEIDVKAIVKKTIAETKGTRYNSYHGRPESAKGVGKEVPNGTF